MTAPHMNIETEVRELFSAKMRDDGTYAIRFQVYGDGPWHDGIGIPNECKIGGIFKKERGE
mgnify:FL=1